MTALAIALITLPATVAVTLLGASLAGFAPSERGVAWLVRAATLGSGGLSLALAGVWGRQGDATIALGDWYAASGHELPLTIAVNAGAVAACLAVSAIAAVVLRLAEPYLHADPGHVRFFATAVLAMACLQAIALAGSLDTLFFGWELLGLCSFVLISHHHQRAAPVSRAVRALLSYRTADLGILLSLLLLHAVHASTEVGPSAQAAPDGLAAIVGCAILLTAAGKSGMPPFTGWLARCTEGPTPATALFYGALSVHAGPYLLLRSWDLYAGSPVARVALIGLGLITAASSSLAARARTDVKGAIVLAGNAQIGLIVAEIGLGLHGLAGLHMAGNAALRAVQLLRAPSVLHLAHRRDGLAGRHLARPWRIPAPLWWRARDLFGTDAALRAATLALVTVARGVDRASRAIEHLVAGPERS